MKNGSLLGLAVVGIVCGLTALACSGGASTPIDPASNGNNNSSSGGGATSDGTKTGSDTGNGGGGSNGGKNTDPDTTTNGATCSKPTGTFEETRTSSTIKAPDGSDSPCDSGARKDSVDFDQPPGGALLPGCTKKKDSWSVDQCVHTIETHCDDRDETCTEVITFTADKKSYSGTRMCSGQFSGVDADGPFTCKTVITATRK